jgi:putative flippase GtrA
MSVLYYVHGYDIFLARLCSFTVAVTVTWLLNRKITFTYGASPRRFEEWSRYVAVGLVGAAINFVVFLGLVHWGPRGIRLPLLALTIASLFALLFTYTGSRIFVFPEDRKFDAKNAN